MSIKPRKSLFLAPIYAVIVSAAMAFVAHAAITPTLTLSSVGNGEIQVTVTGDPNASVNLYYYTEYPSLATNVGTIGSTASNEYFSTTLLSGQYNIPSNAYVYAMVDGVASQAILWPYTNGAIYPNYPNNNSITFSPSSVSIAPAQTAAVTLYGGSGQYYISQNSSLVTASINGDTINLYGVTDGSGSIVVCSSNSSYGSNNSCGTLYITVTGSSSGYSYPTTYPTYPATYPITYPITYPTYPLISLSQSSINITAGQSESLGIYGTDEGYYIYSNSNSYVASASISGDTLLVGGNQPGVSYIMICESVGSSCTTLYVNVNAVITYSPPIYYQPQPVYFYQQPIVQQVFRPISYIFQPMARYFSYMNPRNW